MITNLGRKSPIYKVFKNSDLLIIVAKSFKSPISNLIFFLKIEKPLSRDGKERACGSAAARGRGGGALNPRGDGGAGPAKRAAETAVGSLRFSLQEVETMV